MLTNTIGSLSRTTICIFCNQNSLYRMMFNSCNQQIFVNILNIYSFLYDLFIHFGFISTHKIHLDNHWHMC